ncbi:hypothetical protein Patl1_12011 [Pistacia atlantica]|uniref:Uncharacterized protein n=1 Tax=Pistacia atlantica TaxID=434234 RepID=A0ACC1A4Q4_9ROSI|nr:hypothetical protein Patl1_12011 [Pistacia atlantica]
MLESTEAVNTEERLKGKSPIHAAILSATASEITATGNDLDSYEHYILIFLLGKEPKFIHGRDEEERTVLHLAASVGYLEAVDYLLTYFSFIVVRRDNRGASLIHMAAIEGHVSVIHKLLPYCPDPWKRLDSNDKNMLHFSAGSGAFNVVRYVLIIPELKMLINQRDKDGNTPLHLATINWHPKIVSALTWDERVDLTLVNNARQTAIDVAENHMERNRVASFRKRLTWVALEAEGAARAPPMIMNAYKKSTDSKPLEMDYYKDKVNTLLVVSTFVVTATYAAGFTMPCGFKNSDPDEGTATLLGRNVFGIFIFCDTIAMYCSILAAVTVLWGQMGDAYDLVLMVVRFALPLMGISLIMMNLAFIAGIYLVVSKLSWLGIAVLVLGALFLVVLSLLFFPLFLPIWSRNCILRRMFHHPFQRLIELTGSY